MVAFQIMSRNSAGREGSPLRVAERRIDDMVVRYKVMHVPRDIFFDSAFCVLDLQNLDT